MKQSKFIYQDNEKFALRVVGIKKSYGKNEVLKGVNLEVQKGERIALLGRNGSGKSTLISLITQQRAFHDGTVVYGYADTKSKALELLGVQFQNLSYPEGFFVKDVLKLFQSAVPLGIRLTKQQLDDLIVLFGIKPYLKQRIDKLSGGQQQRVNIILSLIKRPKLLILDEISSGLDVKSSTDIKNYIKEYLKLDKEVSLIIVSHNIEEVIELTKTSYVLKEGLIAESFPSKNLNLDKFMDIVSIDIDLVAKNIKQAREIAIIQKVNKEYDDVKNNYTDDIKKQHEKFAHNLNFREAYRLQDELTELKLPEFKTKLAIKVTEKTAANKEKDQKEFNQKEKELIKNSLYKKIPSNEKKLLELNSKEFQDVLYAKLVSKHKKDRLDLETNLKERKKILHKYIEEHPISALDNIVKELEKELVNLNNQKNPKVELKPQELTKTVSEKAKNHDKGLIVDKEKDIIAIDKEIAQIKINIQKANIMKEEIAIDVAKETKKIDHDERHLEDHMNVLIKKDNEEIANLIKNHIVNVTNDLKVQKIAIKKCEEDFEIAKDEFTKKYQNQTIDDKKLVKTIIKKEIDLRIKELHVLEKALTQEQDGIVSKQQEYSQNLCELEKGIPKKIKELEEIDRQEKARSDAKIIAHDKSYENSWTNNVYDFLDKGKTKFNIRPPKKGNIIEIRHLSKNYKHIKAVQNFNLEIKDGDRIAITGPNGSGKSTIVSMLAQLIKPNYGEIAYSFGKTKRSVINNVGVQFQNSSFPQEMSVFDVVIFFARANRYSLTKNEINNALKVFKLDNLRKNKAYLLSGGEKQRLNVLLALIKKPKLVILDEISTGLDIDSIHKINGYVKEYLDKSKATLIIISHNYEEIHNLANKLVILNYGVKTEEHDIHNWTQEQVKAKMFKIFSNDKNEHTENIDIDDKSINDSNFKEVYLLQDELEELKSPEFKAKLTAKISKNTEMNTKKLQKEFVLEEKELTKNPLYKKIESNERKLVELKSKEFDDIVYANLEPKHKKDLLDLENDLKEKKKTLKKYTDDNSINALDNIIKDLKEELVKLSPEKSNIIISKTENSSSIIEKQNQNGKENSIVNSGNKLTETDKKINQINIDIEKVNTIKEEVLADIKKQTEEIDYDEKHLESQINAIIKKDKEEIAELVKNHILVLTSEVEHQKIAIKKHEEDFAIVKNEYDKNQKNRIGKDKILIETIIEEEMSIRNKELGILKKPLIKDQNGVASKKQTNNQKLPKLDKAISLRIKELNNIEKQEQQKIAEIYEEVSKE